MTTSQAINSTCWQTLYINVNLATMDDGANSYGEILNGALAISKGKIAWLGKQSDLPGSLLDSLLGRSGNNSSEGSVEVLNGNGQWLTQG